MRRVLIVLLLAVLFVGIVSGQFSDDGYGHQDNIFVDFDEFEFDSQWEILTELVAPFLLLFVIFYIGLERALNFTTSTDDMPWNKDEQKSKNKKYATLISLIITISLVPTVHFQEFRELTAYLFGTIVYTLYLVVFLGFIYLLFKLVN